MPNRATRHARHRGSFHNYRRAVRREYGMDTRRAGVNLRRSLTALAGAGLFVPRPMLSAFRGIGCGWRRHTGA
jgi:hypothetical protein